MVNVKMIYVVICFKLVCRNEVRFFLLEVQVVLGWKNLDNNNIRVLFVDDYEIVRCGFKVFINVEDVLEVSVEVVNVFEVKSVLDS